MMMITLLIVAVSTVSAVFYTSDSTSQKYTWETYKREWNKVYENAEEDLKRFEIFVQNLVVIDARNAEEARVNGTAVHGLTKFSDFSQEEFQNAYLRSKIDPTEDNEPKVSFNKAPLVDLGLVDWTGIYTTPIKDQGYCGSCWAFSATEQIESSAMRTLSTTYLLSPEQITECACDGCNGGWTERAYKYVKKAGGLELDADYPYTSYYGRTGKCNPDGSKFVITVKSYTAIESDEATMAAYVQSTGPLSVCLDASSWNSYTGGIMKVCGQDVDHCVQAVGVDASTGGYWKVRNSWGTSWGESGYIRLAYGINACDITDDPTDVVVKLV